MLLHRLSVFVFAFIIWDASLVQSRPSKRCSKPSIRKEWRSIGHAGRKRFIDAIKCLTALPHDPKLTPTGASPTVQPINPDSSLYDDIAYVHMDAVDSVHLTGRFFPWHRLYVHAFETLARENCNYSDPIPFWDWTIDSADVEHSLIFDPDPDTGLGAFPDASTNYTIVTGGFKDLQRAYPWPHVIQRNFTLRPWQIPFFALPFTEPNKEANVTQTPQEWIKLVTGFVGNLSAFQAYVDGTTIEGVHGATHLSLGGDVSDLAHSPNDPVFFLLHCNLDRLWYSWQRNNTANRYAIGGGEIQTFLLYDTYPTGMGPSVTNDTKLYLANMGPDATIGDVLDTRRGPLCYDYDY